MIINKKRCQYIELLKVKGEKDYIIKYESTNQDLPIASIVDCEYLEFKSDKMIIDNIVFDRQYLRENTYNMSYNKAPKIIQNYLIEQLKLYK